MDVIVGTAGHIDHGKTALVKALTGIDADRLPDEKRRGITIDIGFAEMSAADIHFGFVDVPGHERFVRNMLAGATGIDIVLFVVAADEGVMPQTREHFDICRLLGIRSGVIALTKCDKADSETLELARIECAELVEGSFLSDAPIVRVSSITGSGIEDVRSALVHAANKIPPRQNDHVTRLSIDRSFTAKGFGTVVTGTLASGEIAVGDQLELMPAGKKVRVRGLQTYGFAAESVAAGQRVAINLAGVEHSEVSRGMSLVEEDTLIPTQMIDAEVEVLPHAKQHLRTRQRVRVHIGTSEILARVQVMDHGQADLPSEPDIFRGRKGFVQLRLESPAVAMAGEHFIIRSYSPQVTIAGGIVIDPLPVRHRRKDFAVLQHHLFGLLNEMGGPDAPLFFIPLLNGHKGFTRRELQARSGLRSEVLFPALERAVRDGSIIDANGIYLGDDALRELQLAAISLLTKFHKSEPLSPGLLREELIGRAFPKIDERIGAAVVGSLIENGRLVLENEFVRLVSHDFELRPEETAFNAKLTSLLQTSGLEVPRLSEALAAIDTKLPRATIDKLVRLLMEKGTLVRVTDEFYFHRDVIERTIAALRSGEVQLLDVAAFKNMTGVSRKYAIPLLEHFDRIGVTRRAGDKRVIVR